MKVLHLISSLKVGGAESLLCDLVEQLQQKKIEQTVVYFHEGPFLKRLENRGIKTYQIKGKFGIFDPFFWNRLYRVVKLEKPTCIHASLWAANVAGRIIGKIVGIPVICALHNNHDQNGLIRNTIDSCTLWLADEIIAVSEGIVRTMQKYRFMPAQRVRVIKNGIRAEQIRKKSEENKILRHELGLEDHHFVIGSVGRFVPVKNYHFLLQVFAHLHKKYRNTRLVLVGGGPLENGLREQVQRLGLKSTVIFVSGKKAIGYYPLFNCFVQSSAKEGISMALLEAMSLGAPCIVTNAELEHDVIKHGENGLLVPANNGPLLFEAFSSLIDDDQLRNILSQAGRTTIEKEFVLSRMVDEYYATYGRIQAKKL